MTIAAPLLTCTGARATSGWSDGVPISPGLGIPDQGFGAAESRESRLLGSTGAASLPSWSSFLEALGIMRDIAVERPAPAPPTSPLVSADPRLEGSEDRGSSLAGGVSLEA